MTPIKRIADSPEATSTPSGPNTTRSSTRGLDSPLTPATSVSDEEVEDKKVSVCRTYADVHARHLVDH